MTVLPLLPVNEATPVPEKAPSLVRISDLRQWIYCPRVVWWTQVCPVGKVVSYKMQQGLLKERRLQHLQQRRTLRRFGLQAGDVESNVNLYSAALGLVGKLDLLIRDDERRIPVEVKFTRGPARLNHRIQLAGYALLLQDLYGTEVTCGYIARLPDDTVERIEIDQPLREMTERTIAALRATIGNERIPPANPILGRCTDCEYRRFCGDVGC